MLFVTAVPSFAAQYKSGEEVIAAMHKRYDGKWYKTLTFQQKTTNYKPDGTSEAVGSGRRQEHYRLVLWISQVIGVAVPLI